MQEQKDEGSKEAPKAVPYVLCYPTPAFPKAPVQVGSPPPFGLAALVAGPVRYEEASWQGRRALSGASAVRLVALAQLACCSSLACGCPTQLKDGNATHPRTLIVSFLVWQ